MKTVSTILVLLLLLAFNYVNKSSAKIEKAEKLILEVNEKQCEHDQLVDTLKVIVEEIEDNVVRKSKHE